MSGPTTCPRITVLVPVWNGEHQIGLCLDALSTQTLPADQFDVIVVDNGSTDGTAGVVARYPFARMLSEPQPGSYRARNTGLAEVRGEYVALTDADCVPDPVWLEQVLATFAKHREAGIVAGNVELFRVSPEDSETCEAYERLFVLNQERYASRGHCATANWSSPTELLRGLGGFNATLKSSGDFEMATRIRAAGGSLVYSPEAIVRHPIRGQIKDILQKRTRVLGGQWTLKKGKVPAWKFAASNVLNAFRGSRIIAAKAGMRPGLKVKLFGLLAILAFNDLREQTRLMLGGEPRRS